MKYVEIKLWKCRNHSNPIEYKDVECQDQEVIDSYFNKEQLSFAFVNAFFNLESYSEYFNYFIDDSLFFELEANTIKKANFFIQKSGI